MKFATLLTPSSLQRACNIHVDGKRGPGRPKMTWKLSAINPHDRHTRRAGVRSAMRAVSQLPGRGGGGALMWMLPLYLHVNKKSGDDDDDDDVHSQVKWSESTCPIKLRFTCPKIDIFLIYRK